MTLDIFCGVGRNSYFDPLETHVRQGIDILAEMAATRFGSEYSFVAGETCDNLEIFGRYGHSYTKVSMSEGIRARLGRWDDVIFVPCIANERRLRDNALFHRLGCVDGSLISVASTPRPGMGRTGIAVISTKPLPKPQEADVQFMHSIAESAAHYIDTISVVRKIASQMAATWKNVDEFSMAFSHLGLATAIFDTHGQHAYSNQTWQTMSVEQPHEYTTGTCEAAPMPFVPNPGPAPISLSDKIKGSRISFASYNVNTVAAPSALDVPQINSLIREVRTTGEFAATDPIWVTLNNGTNRASQQFGKLIAYPIYTQNKSIGYIGIIFSILSNMESNHVEESHTEQIESSYYLSFLINMLNDTLKRTRSSRWRGENEYTTARKWTAPLKDFQIKAVRALKSDMPESFVALCAQDLAELASSKFGRSITAVVPIPCGYSPSHRCFSTKLGYKVAELLDVPCVEAFPHSGLSSSSGPHKAQHVSAPPPSVSIDGPVLLVDDVVTTGTHLERYASALKAAGMTTFSVGWVGPHDLPRSQ